MVEHLKANSSKNPKENISYVGKRELAQLFGVSRRTVDSWMGDGLPHLKLSARMVRFRLSEVENWLNDKYRTQRRRGGKEGAE